MTHPHDDCPLEIEYPEISLEDQQEYYNNNSYASPEAHEFASGGLTQCYVCDVTLGNNRLDKHLNWHAAIRTCPYCDKAHALKDTGVTVTWDNRAGWTYHLDELDTFIQQLDEL